MAFSDLAPDLRDTFWRFVRGDMGTEEFENWLYISEALEPALGAEDHLHAISVNFRDARQVADFKAFLGQHLAKPAACDCHMQPDTGSVRLGAWPLDRFESIDRGIDGLWWLHRMKCRECGTLWQVAAEERIYDVWLLSRDAGGAPPQVRTYRALLSAARSSGAFVRYLEPSMSWEIPAAIQDLAEETPGIACSEIEKLLPVDARIARQHAREVATRHRLQIDFGA